MKEIEQLYTLYKDDLYSYLYSLTHDRSWSEDLVMETYLKAIMSLITYQGTSSIKTWLFGIARHCWLQSLRKRKDCIEYDDAQLSRLHVLLVQQKKDREKLMRCLELIDSYSQREKSIFYLRLEGTSYEEISERLSLSVGSCRVIEHRIRKKLIDQLRKEGYDD